MGVFPMVICKSPSLHVPSLKDLSPLDPIDFSELKFPFTLNKGDIPEVFLNGDPNDPYVRLVMELGEADVNSWVSLLIALKRLKVSMLEHLNPTIAMRPKLIVWGHFPFMINLIKKWMLHTSSG
ncbi:hypothetical protein CFP56_019190 [Quercus suber]|uniref:Uncharacterized protein n=1 Tax=Quercus suber TaxID=58331 RepID=A0AAW0M3A2_QUESU